MRLTPGTRLRINPLFQDVLMKTHGKDWVADFIESDFIITEIDNGPYQNGPRYRFIRADKEVTYNKGNFWISGCENIELEIDANLIFVVRSGTNRKINKLDLLDL